MPEIKCSSVIDRLEAFFEHARQFAEDDDDESAHVEEKKAWELALEFLAEEAAEPWKSVAEAALQTKQLQFHRWFA